MVSPSFFWHNKKTVWEGIYILTAYSIIKNCDVLMVMCPGMSVYICVCVLTNEGEMEFRETNARHRMEFLKLFWYPDYIASHLGQVRI